MNEMSSGSGRDANLAAQGRDDSATPSPEERFEIERTPDGSWYATYLVDGEAKAGSGRWPSPLDALKWALPVGMFSEGAN